MKITCPSCAAEYNVPGELAAGRIVRCAKCSTQWAPVPPPPVEVAPLVPPAPPEAEAPVAMPDPPARLAPPAPPKPVRRRPSPLLLAWLASILVIVAALAAALVLREPIMRGWPPSQRVYGVLGLRAASPDVHGDVVK